MNNLKKIKPVFEDGCIELELWNGEIMNIVHHNKEGTDLKSDKNEMYVLVADKQAKAARTTNAIKHYCWDMKRCLAL